MAGLVQFRVDDSSPTVTYSPFGDTFSSPNLSAGWNPYWEDPGFSTKVPGAIGSGTSLHITSLNGASLRIQWTGIGIQLVGNVSSASYIVTIDDQAVSPSANLAPGTLFFVDNLGDGDHQLVLTMQTDTPDAQFNFDGAVISALPSPANVSQSNFTQQILNDTMDFIGAWTFVNASHQSTTAGDMASTQFVGTAIQLRGTTSPQAGSYSVTLDNVTTSFSARSSFLERDSLLFFASGLDAETTHALEIANTANQTALVLPVGSISVWTLEKPSSPSIVEPGGPSLAASGRNGVPTATISGSAVSVGLVLAAIILVLWVRKRRRLRASQRTAVAEQFPVAQERVFPANNLRTKFSLTGNVHDLPQPDPFSIRPKRRLLAANNGVETDSPRGETLTVRIGGMEAPLETFSTMGLAESSPPPSYKTRT
ncbi:hypothetical protein K438DRAFT_1728946 [Mycena galopus ATCC 62051]|nr:hypothetical protein K438DRAFT_1728946 [Mycena galopus ATCC 62051]